MPETKVIVNLSNRPHSPVRDDLEALFGKGYQTDEDMDLIQPGQFACAES
jgi:propanediol utilization protein